MLTFPSFQSKQTYKIYKQSNIPQWHHMIFKLIILMFILETSRILEDFYNPFTAWPNLMRSKGISWGFYILITLGRGILAKWFRNKQQRYLDITDLIVALLVPAHQITSYTIASNSQNTDPFWVGKESLRFFGIYFIISLSYYNWFYMPLTVSGALIMACAYNLSNYKGEQMLWVPTYAGFIICYCILCYSHEKIKRKTFESEFIAFGKEKVWKEILNVLPQGIIAANKQKEILYSNEALCNLLNFNSFEVVNSLSEINRKVEIKLESYHKGGSEIMDMNSEIIIVSNFAELQQQVWERWDSLSKRFDSEPLPNEDFLVFKGTFNSNGRKKTLDLKMTMKHFAGSVIVLFIFSDISERVLVNSLKHTLEYKNRLLASVSHELRTPLNGNMNFIQAAIKDKRISPGIRDKYLTPALRSARYLLTIINDILDFSQIQAECLRLSYSVKNITETAHEALELVELQAEKKGISLELILPRDNWECEILTDHNRVLQIMSNLLSNALKFTFKGTIKLRIVPESDRVLRIEIEDTGIGIKQEDHPKLFKLFGKLDLEEKNYINSHGVGLGLVISNALAKMLRPKATFPSLHDSYHSGSTKKDHDDRGIFFESEYGKGSKFYFRIEDQTDISINEKLDTVPFEHTEAPEMPEFTPRTLLLPRGECSSATTLLNKCNCPQILIVDDDAFNLVALENIISSLNLKCATAYNGQQALDIVTERMNNPCSSDCLPFRMIFMDCHMPIMDGYQCAMKLRELFSERIDYTCPIVACTAAIHTSEQKRAKESGMDDFCTKPISKAQIQKILKNYNVKKVSKT